MKEDDIMGKKSIVNKIIAGTLMAAAVFTAGSIIDKPKTVYAAVQTGGFSTATGSTERAVTVTNLQQLENAFKQRKHHIVISGHIYGGPALKTFTFADTGWNNTTIEGKPGTNATLENIKLKFDGEMLANDVNISNIVVKNINFRGKISDLQRLSGKEIVPGGSGTNYEGVSLRRITNCLIDHCTMFDMSDDLMSIALKSDRVTVSYCHFYFTNEWLKMNPNPLWNWVGKYQDLASERLAIVIGANANDSYEYGGHKLRVTMHHNWFGPNMKGRPLMRGYVHLYNNYFDNSTTPDGQNSVGSSQKQYNANQIGSGSVIYSEGNYFYKTNQSNQIGLDKATDKYSFYERDNYYNQTTGNSATGTYFSNKSFGYGYTLDSVKNVPNIVQASAGVK